MNILYTNFANNNKCLNNNNINANLNSIENSKYLQCYNHCWLKNIVLKIWGLLIIIFWCIKNFYKDSILIINKSDSFFSFLYVYISRLLNSKVIILKNKNDNNNFFHRINAKICTTSINTEYKPLNKNKEKQVDKALDLNVVKITYFIITIFCLLILIYGYIIVNQSICRFSLVIYFITIFLISIINYKKYLPLIFFLISFFTFTMGQYIFKNVTNDFMYYLNFNNEIINYTISIQFLALFFTFFGYNYLFSSQCIKKIKIKDFSKKISIVKVFEYLITIGLILSLSFSIITNFEKAVYSLKYGYISIYDGSLKSIFPMFIHRISSYYFIFYAFYLTLNKNLTYKKIASFFLLLNGVIVFIYGVRSELMANILFLIFYYIWYHINKNIEVPRKVKKIAFVSIILVPFLLIGLNSYNYIRNHIKVPNDNFFNKISAFFAVQGRSINILNYSQLYESILVSGNSQYVFGVFNQELNSKIKTITQDTIDFPKIETSKTNLAIEVSRLVLGNNLVEEGNGLGSQYLAELWLEGGIFGIVLYSILLGYIMSFFYYYSTKHFLFQYFSFSLFNSLITTPRGTAIELFTPFISFVNISLIIILLLFNELQSFCKGDEI